MKFGPKETKQLNEYLRTGRNRNRQFLTTQLADDLEPGSLKDELTKDFDPKQETYEEYLQRKNLERPFNMAGGGRIGFEKAGFVYTPKKSAETVTLTPQMVIDIAEKNPDFTATDILKKLDKDKTKNYVNRFGNPPNRKIINRTLSETFDLEAEKASKIPKGFISSREFFNTEGMPISKEDYMTVKNRNPSMLTDTIGKNSVFIKQGKGGQGEFYYKKPTEEDIKLYQRIASKKGRLQTKTINLMFEFDKNFGDLYAKGELPLLNDPTGKNKNTIHNLISKDITPSTAGNVTARLSQWYNGADFINPELKNLKRNKSKGINIQKATDKFQFGNFYKDQAYKVALDTIDEKIGREIGTFKAFKDNIKTALKKAGLPIYSKNTPYGFNLNEIAGVTGAAKTKTAAFSDFVDMAEGGFNQGKLSRFQGEFSELREKLDKLDLANNVQNRGKAQSLINTFQDRIKYYEEATGSTLPNVGLGTADKYYPKEQLADIAKERFVGETGKKKNRIVPGTDLLSSSKNAGYTVIVPKNYRTVGQIMETGQRDVLKKNVKKTLEGMKKFFNEYDEKKMLQKLKDASPDTLRKMMRVIPKVVSVEDDFLNAYGFPLTAGLDSGIGVRPVEEEKNFIQRNPLTTAAGTAAAAATTKTGRNILKRLATGAFTPTGVALQTAGLGGLDLTTPAGRLSLGAEAAFAPELVKASIGATRGMKNRALQKGIQQALNLGLPTRLALRAARIASPIGIATLAGEGLYQAGKFSRDRIRELQAMSPEQRQQLRAEQSALAFEGARDGGLIGKKSGPPPISGPTPHGDEGLPGVLKRVKNS